MRKAIFNTKFKDHYDRNGQTVEVIKCKKGKDVYSDRYTVKFPDGKVVENIYTAELDFGF